MHSSDVWLGRDEKDFIIFFTFPFSSLSQSQSNRPPISPKWVFEPWVWEDAANTRKQQWN